MSILSVPKVGANCTIGAAFVLAVQVGAAISAIFPVWWLQWWTEEKIADPTIRLQLRSAGS
jgi:hypothetical protein